MIRNATLPDGGRHDIEIRDGRPRVEHYDNSWPLCPGSWGLLIGGAGASDGCFAGLEALRSAAPCAEPRSFEYRRLAERACVLLREARDAGRLEPGIVPARPMLEAPGRARREGFGVDPDDTLCSARAPEGVEQLVEPLKVRATRREQGSHCGAQALGPIGKRAGDQPRGVLGLRLAYDEAGVAQGQDEAGEAPAHRQSRTGAFGRQSMRAHHATPLMRPGRRAGSSSPG